MTRPSRCAVYWVPPAASALARFGARWLGRDAETGAPLAPDPAWGDPAWIATVTAEPRHYGLHATLKPPFRLAEGRTRAALVDALAGFAARAAPVLGPPLVLRRLGRFLALVPDGPAPAVEALAACVVEVFDAFRAPPEPAELARRRAHRLSPAHQANLVRWGYPYVMAEFRFHVTLSGALDPATLERLESLLAPLVAPFAASPLALGELALFEQPDGAAPFRLTRRFALAGAAAAP
jgi:putative phosphonate metabolism protein